MAVHRKLAPPALNIASAVKNNPVADDIDNVTKHIATVAKTSDGYKLELRFRVLHPTRMAGNLRHRHPPSTKSTAYDWACRHHRQ